jgi:hypothetical protein
MDDNSGETRDWADNASEPIGIASSLQSESALFNLRREGEYSGFYRSFP